jgi:hypothetical protein
MIKEIAAADGNRQRQTLIGGGVMYIDGVVVAGLVTVIAMITMLGCVGYYGYRHIRQDVARNRAEEREEKKV